MSTEASLRTFFSSKNFAVVGASSNTAKFGHKSKTDRAPKKKKPPERPEDPNTSRFKRVIPSHVEQVKTGDEVIRGI